MATAKINGVNLYYELTGSGRDPMVFVHGSWVDHQSWELVAKELAKDFRVLTYDRRGHSQSERVIGQGNINEDVKDLITLVEEFDLSPAHIVGNSFGGNIVLRTAATRPDIFKSMLVHEPPLLSLIEDDPNVQGILPEIDKTFQQVVNLILGGNRAKAAQIFVDQIALGSGSWEQLPEMIKKSFVFNAMTWYDELQDPQSLQIDLSSLSNFKKPTLLSTGSDSPPFFPIIIDCLKASLAQAKQITIDGAGHVPQMSHPEKYIDMVKGFCLQTT